MKVGLAWLVCFGDGLNDLFVSKTTGAATRFQVNEHAMRRSEELVATPALYVSGVMYLPVLDEPRLARDVLYSQLDLAPAGYYYSRKVSRRLRMRGERHRGD